jgi:hypothetical protein
MEFAADSIAVHAVVREPVSASFFAITGKAFCNNRETAEINRAKKDRFWR